MNWYMLYLNATSNSMHNLYSYPRTPLSGPDHLPLSPPPSLSGLPRLRYNELRTVLKFPSKKTVMKRTNNTVGYFKV